MTGYIFVFHWHILSFSPSFDLLPSDFSFSSVCLGEVSECVRVWGAREGVETYRWSGWFPLSEIWVRAHSQISRLHLWSTAHRYLDRPGSDIEGFLLLWSDAVVPPGFCHLLVNWDVTLKSKILVLYSAVWQGFPHYRFLVFTFLSHWDVLDNQTNIQI